MYVLGCWILAGLTAVTPWGKKEPLQEGWLRFEFDKPVAEELWEDLQARLTARPIERVRWQVGLRSDWTGETPGPVVVVKVHGACAAPDQRLPWRKAPLGWVDLVDGEWLSFVHVDCARLGEAMQRTKNPAMAPAMAAVIRHELIHLMRRTMLHDPDSGFPAELCGEALLRIEDFERRSAN